MWNAIRIGALASVVVAAGGVRAADNQLTAREKAAGWQLMFDGKSFAGWEDPAEEISAGGFVRRRRRMSEGGGASADRGRPFCPGYV